MTVTNDTIVAPATPYMPAALAITRLSGPQAISIADKIWKGKKLKNAQSHTAHVGYITDNNKNPLDQAVITVYRAPHSFTGEDSIEISTHGSTFIQRQLLNLLIENGARLAQPGEFTRRAFLNGQLGLTQAEAVADIIAADSHAAHKAAISQLQGRFAEKIQQLRNQLIELTTLLELELDFSEEDVEFASRAKLNDISTQIYNEVTSLLESFKAGNAIRNGIPVAIIGPANAGKSSLLNALLGYERAIVSNIPGTTRDVIDDTLHLGDYILRIIDTAGLRNTLDPIEQLGIQHTYKTISSANIIIFVADISESFPSEEFQDIISTAITHNDTLKPHLLVVLNKSDLHHDCAKTQSIISELNQNIPIIPISILQNRGIDDLRRQLLQECQQITHTSSEIIITNERHRQSLALAQKSLIRLHDELKNSISSDLIAQTLREIISHLAAITGTIQPDTILSNIFSHFCIGK